MADPVDQYLARLLAEMDRDILSELLAASTASLHHVPVVPASPELLRGTQEMEADQRPQERRNGLLYKRVLAADRATMVREIHAGATPGWRFVLPVTDALQLSPEYTFYVDSPFGIISGRVAEPAQNDWRFIADADMPMTHRLSGIVRLIPGTAAINGLTQVGGFCVIIDSWCHQSDNYGVPPFLDTTPNVQRPPIATVSNVTAPTTYPAVQSARPVTLSGDDVPLDAIMSDGIKNPPVPAPAPVPVIQAEPVSTLTIKQSKPIIDQALDEGYVPTSKDSPTELLRPVAHSPTQVLGYLMACCVRDKNLAVNEMQAIIEDPDLFFTRRWPVWAEVSKPRPKVTYASKK